MAVTVRALSAKHGDGEMTLTVAEAHADAMRKLAAGYTFWTNVAAGERGMELGEVIAPEQIEDGMRLIALTPIAGG